MCTDCNDHLPPIYISEPQVPHCENCGSSDGVCIDKLDASCVVYNYQRCDLATTLPHLGISSCTSLQTILEKIDSLIGTSFNIPLTVVDTPTINLTTTGAAGHTLQADVLVSSDQDNLLTVRGNGLYVLPGYKVKVNSTDVPDYLENQIEAGTDPLGLVTLTISTVGGKVRIVPSLNLNALCTALQNAGCVCGSPGNLVLS